MDADVQAFHQDFTAMQRSLDAAAVTQREMTAKVESLEATSRQQSDTIRAMNDDLQRHVQNDVRSETRSKVV